jgi:hypothetical protein
VSANFNRVLDTELAKGDGNVGERAVSMAEKKKPTLVRQALVPSFRLSLCAAADAQYYRPGVGEVFITALQALSSGARNVTLHLRDILGRMPAAKPHYVMLAAVRFPDGHRGRKRSSETEHVLKSGLSAACLVRQFRPEMVDAVIARQTGLDEAYQETRRWRQTGQRTERRMLNGATGSCHQSCGLSCSLKGCASTGGRSASTVTSSPP